MYVFRVSCQVKVSATGRSLDRRCPIECNPSVISKPQRLGGPDPLRLSSHGKKILLFKACYIVWITLNASYSLFTIFIINNCKDEGENTEQGMRHLRDLVIDERITVKEILRWRYMKWIPFSPVWYVSMAGFCWSGYEPVISLKRWTRNWLVCG